MRIINSDYFRKGKHEVFAPGTEKLLRLRWNVLTQGFIPNKNDNSSNGFLKYVQFFIFAVSCNNIDC